MDKERVLELAKNHKTPAPNSRWEHRYTFTDNGLLTFSAAIERETLEQAAEKMTQWTGKGLLEQWAQEVKS